MVLDCSSRTSRGSLSVEIFLLLSDPDAVGCPALFSPPLSSSIATRSVLLTQVTSWVDPVPTSLVMSLVQVFSSVLAVMLGRALDAGNPPYETEGCGVEP